ncbi:MAG: thermonuclease family protein [Chloroflexota bacterium]
MDRLNQAVKLIQTGNKVKGREELIAILREDSNIEAAWLWMYAVAKNDQERKACLIRALKLNPNNAKARQLLDQLRARSESPNLNQPKRSLLKVAGGKAKGSTIKPKQATKNKETQISSTRFSWLTVVIGLFLICICISIAGIGMQFQQANTAVRVGETIAILTITPPLVETPRAELGIADPILATDTTVPDQTVTPTPLPSLTFTSTPLPEPTLTSTPAATATASPQPLAASLEGNVNIRSGPSTNFDVVGELATDQSVEIIGQNETNDWWQVVVGNETGWVAASVTQVQNVTNVPIVITPAPKILAVNENVTTAQVVNVVDGDTIDVRLDGQIYRLRYILMDTPEKNEPFANQATEANRRLVEGKVVTLEKDVSQWDRYERLLRYVHLGDIMVNEELIRQGMASVATFPPDVKYVDRFRAVEREAQAVGRGIWGVAPTPPPTATIAAPVVRGGQVIISRINYDGIVKRVESDEYAEITNVGNEAVNLAGWRLDADDPNQVFTFPDFLLAAGQSCRVYTNEIHPESCGFSFGIGRAIWANKGDCGHLFNASGQEVSTKCY